MLYTPSQLRDAIVRLIDFIGDDPDREGLKDTPSRVLRAYAEMFSGYNETPSDYFRTFEDGACDEMILCKDIEFFSTCEHHILPFVGSAHIAYIPNKRVIGLSKLVRVLEVFSRRLQIQERIGQQVTECLDEHLQPIGSACILEASHLCVACRGVKKQHSKMITSSLTGAFKDEAKTRLELFQLIKGG